MNKNLINKKSVKSDLYQDLANAIIIQAATDYRVSRAFLKKHPHTPELDLEMEKKSYERDQRTETLLKKITEHENTIVSIEKFLTSAWAQFLSKADTVLILKRLQEEEC